MSDTIRSIGSQMATMMYNLSQGANLPAGTRDLMRDMHQRWDAAVSAEKAPPPQALLVVGDLVEKAFEIGFAWRSQLILQNVEDSRAVGRTLQSYLFDDMAIDTTGFNAFDTGDNGIVEAKKRIIAALRRAALDSPSTVNNPATLEKSDFQKFDVEGERLENEQETPKQHVVVSAGFELEWLSGARPPTHPRPMHGSQTFGSLEAAVSFFGRLAPDAKLISLTEKQYTSIDRTRDAAAVLAARASAEVANG